MPEAADAGATATLPRVTLKIARASDQTFIYRKMVQPAALPPGELVEVADRTGRVIGSGFYNPRSQLAVRLLSDDPADPAGEAWLARRLQAAVGLRVDALGLPGRTDAMRLVHAEGDGLPGLIVDRFGPFVVCELFSAGWYRLLKPLLRQLKVVVGERLPGEGDANDTAGDSNGRAPTVLVRADADVEMVEGFKVRDFVAEGLSAEALRPIIHEDGVRFRVDLRRGHKTGFFCDQRDNRARVAGFARGKRMLDAFCYTGGFGCHALAAGAASVLAVDWDESAVALAQENAALNGAAERFEARHADAFHVLRDLARAGERFDVIVLDPPKLAANKEQLDAALRAYEDMNRLALPLLAPAHGLLVANSCSGLVSEAALLAAMRRAANAAGVVLQHLCITGAAPDHPVASNHPEGRYLKAVYTRVLPR